MSGEMFLPSTLDCPPLRGDGPMITIKNHTRAFCVTSNDNQKRFVVCMASAIHIALLQNGLHMTKVWPPYIISHQVHKIFCPLSAVPGEPLSDVISIRYILGFRKDNAKFFS